MLFEVTDLYGPNYHATQPVVVNQGGTGSSKTYTILQVIFTLLSQSPNLVATVAGQDIPNLKVGALRDAEQIVEGSAELQSLLADYSKSERIFRFHNGSLMEFKSYDGPQDAKSGKRDILFVNEANGIPYPVYQELYLRTRLRTFIDYNPNAEFWAHEHLIGKPHVLFLRSWHVHNQFLPERMRVTIEALKEQDPELWRVYARGMTGKIEGLVFRDVYNVETLPEGAKCLGTGLDFGFTNDPTVALDFYLSGGELYVDEVLHETGLTNPDIFARLASVRAPKLWSIVADSAEPKSIEELRRLGLSIEPAAKGPDSINAGIVTLKAYKINLLPSCVNMKKEAVNYKWKVDRLTGKATNQPVDAFNHCWDAARYITQARLQAPPLIAPRATARSWKKPARRAGRDYGE
jgi:phage terminase large subunit